MDPVSAVSFLHPDPRQLPQGLDPAKHFLKSKDSIIISKLSCPTVVHNYLSVLSFIIIVFIIISMIDC